MAKGEGSAKGWLENKGWGEIPGINPTLATVLNGTTDVVVLAPRASWQMVLYLWSRLQPIFQL